MRHVVCDKARECYQRAADARQRAGEASTAESRSDFLSMETRWLHLAESYEVAARLDRALNESRDRKPTT